MSYLRLAAEFGQLVAKVEGLLEASASLSRLLLSALGIIHITIVFWLDLFGALLPGRILLLLRGCFGLGIPSACCARSRVLLRLEDCCQLGIGILRVHTFLLALLFLGWLNGYLDLVTVRIGVYIVAAMAIRLSFRRRSWGRSLRYFGGRCSSRREGIEAFFYECLDRILFGQE